MRAKTNEIEIRKRTEKIKDRVVFLKKVNKLYWQVFSWTNGEKKRKENKIRNESGNITTDTTEAERIIKDWKWKWKLLSRVLLFVTPWTTQSMEFSRPEYLSG